MCARVCSSAYTSVYADAPEDMGFPRTRSYRSFRDTWLLCGGWALNSGPRDCTEALLPHEPSL